MLNGLSRPRHRRKSLVIPIVAGVGVALLLVLYFLAAANQAHATTTAAVVTTHPQVTPGAPCSPTGATGWRHGVKYVCIRKYGDSCPVWHKAPVCSCSPSASQVPYPPPGTSPSARPSHSPTPTRSSTPSQTQRPRSPSPGAPGHTVTGMPHHPSIGGTLPRTGPPTGVVVLIGIGALVLGAALVAALRRRRDEPEEPEPVTAE